MRYKIGDKVVLRSGTKIEIAFINEKSKLYVGENGYIFAEYMIDHDKTAELNKKNKTLNHYSSELEKIVAEKNNRERMDAIEPAHYRKGLDDLYESAYRTRPFNEYRAIMEFVAERYIKRNKTNRVEDLDKAIYTLGRLKEKEMEE